MYLDVDALLADVTYPTDCDEVLDICGDRTIDLQVGEETVADAIGRCNAGELQSQQAARETLPSSVSEAAIGRKYYSDRDPPIPGVEWHEPHSL